MKMDERSQSQETTIMISRLLCLFLTLTSLTNLTSRHWFTPSTHLTPFAARDPPVRLLNETSEVDPLGPLASLQS